MIYIDYIVHRCHVTMVFVSMRTCTVSASVLAEGGGIMGTGNTYCISVDRFVGVGQTFLARTCVSASHRCSIGVARLAVALELRSSFEGGRVTRAPHAGVVPNGWLVVFGLAWCTL